MSLAIIVAGGAISGGITGGSQGAIMRAFTSVLGLAGGGNAFVSAFAGGGSSALQGGNFGSGFLSAGVTALAVPGINADIGSRVGRVVARALLGGTISQLTGGKFANGATMAAMQGAMGEQYFDDFDSENELVSGQASDGLPSEASVPGRISIEESGFKTAAGAAKAFRARYGTDAVQRRQEPQTAIVELSKDNWGFLTPGWGGVDAVIVKTGDLAAAYKSFGYSKGFWMNLHFDGNQNFSTIDFARSWKGKNGGLQFMGNSNGETRALTRGDLDRELQTIPVAARRGDALSILQSKFRNGLPGSKL